MPLEQSTQACRSVRLEPLRTDELAVQPQRQPHLGVVDVRLAARHPSADVAPERAEQDDGSVRHVLARVAADTLDDGRRPGVANREPFACGAGAEQLAVRCAVENRVAGEARVARVAGR